MSWLPSWLGGSKKETSDEEITEELVFEETKPKAESPFKGFKKVSSSSSSEESKYEDPIETSSESESIETSSESESIETDFGKFCKCIVEVSENYDENVGTMIGARLGDIDLVDKFVEVFEKLQNFHRIGLIMIPENFFQVVIESNNTIQVTERRLKGDSEVKRITDVEIGSAMDKVQIQMSNLKQCQRSIEIGNRVKYNYIFNVGSKPNESFFGVEGSNQMHRLATQTQLDQIKALRSVGAHPSYGYCEIQGGDLEGKTLYLVKYNQNFDSDLAYDLKNISERFEIIKKVGVDYKLHVSYDGFMRDDNGDLYLYYPEAVLKSTGYDTQAVTSTFEAMLGDHYSVLSKFPEFVKENRDYINIEKLDSELERLEDPNQEAPPDILRSKAREAFNLQELVGLLEPYLIHSEGNYDIYRIYSKSRKFYVDVEFRYFETSTSINMKEYELKGDGFIPFGLEYKWNSSRTSKVFTFPGNIMKALRLIMLRYATA